ncbi:MAG TPA: hydrolase [Anaerovoracaceae bacterium]|nr:hydrolase [Anaerovoracaceae bacterium]
MKTLKINKEDAVLVLIDFQERLMPAMADSDVLKENSIKLVKGSRILGLPILVTQQYTKGLGPTISEIHDAIGQYEPIEKTSFSAMGEEAFEKELKGLHKKTIILAGIEAHVCVLQTAIDLTESGYDVFLVSDCISSRSSDDKKYAQRRMTGSGILETTCESVLFELLKDAKHECFKEISKLVK